MNTTIEELKRRKSVRVFEDKPIPDAVKQEILSCAMNAPTAGNQMLYTILDITDKERKKILAETCDNQGFIAEAPMVLIFLADCRRWLDSYAYAGCEYRKPREADLFLACADAIIAAQNAVVAAESLGVGSCYIGDVIEKKEVVTELLSLDKFVFPAAMLVFGYPAEQQKEREKPQRFDPRFIVLENSYRRLTENEHREMFKLQGKDFDTFIPKFFNRKYISDFALEMCRCAELYIEAFRSDINLDE